jgi:hypothetical protein
VSDWVLAGLSLAGYFTGWVGYSAAGTWRMVRYAQWLGTDADFQHKSMTKLAKAGDMNGLRYDAAWYAMAWGLLWPVTLPFIALWAVGCGVRRVISALPPKSQAERDTQIRALEQDIERLRKETGP